jgi:hypothetical protein
MPCFQSFFNKRRWTFQKRNRIRFMFIIKSSSFKQQSCVYKLHISQVGSSIVQLQSNPNTKGVCTILKFILIFQPFLWLSKFDSKECDRSVDLPLCYVLIVFHYQTHGYDFSAQVAGFRYFFRIVKILMIEQVHAYVSQCYAR